MTIRMKCLLKRTLIFSASVAVSSFLFASTLCVDDTCSDSGASRKKLWENDYILTWVTTFPAQSTLDWHRHDADRIIICHEGGELIKTEVTTGTEGESVSTLVFPKDTPTWYNACLPGTLHKDENLHPYPLHFTIIQFKPGVLTPVQGGPINTGDNMLLENDYLTAQKWDVPPHASFPLHTTPYDRIVIASQDFDLIQTTEDGAQRVLSLKERVPVWLDADDPTKPYSAKSTNDEPLALTMILFKPGSLGKASSDEAVPSLAFSSE